MTEVGIRDIPSLNCDVFVTPGIPIATSDLPPGMKQAIASILMYGKRDVVLVDAFMTVKQADALVDWVAGTGKNLTTIYITHGRGDHWFGIGLLERFPNARAAVIGLGLDNKSALSVISLFSMIEGHCSYE